MNYLPVFLRIRNAPCLVVGGGTVALRKIELLLSAGASVTVVSESQNHRILNLVQQQKITHLKREFSSDLLKGMHLVVAATDDRTVNQQVSETAMAQAIPVNVVDQPELSNFIVPSIVDRSPVIIAIGTGGTSPILARLLKSRLETLIPAAYGRLARLADSDNKSRRNSILSTKDDTSGSMCYKDPSPNWSSAGGMMKLGTHLSDSLKNRITHPLRGVRSTWSARAPETQTC